MAKEKTQIESKRDAESIAAALADIFPRIMIHMSRIGGSRTSSVMPLTAPQIKALVALDISGKAMRMAALAHMLGVTQSTATDVTKRLVRMGYLIKETLKEDKRVVCVSLSLEGKRIVKEMRAEKFQQFLAISAALPAAERQRLLKSHQLILEIYSAM